jgi:hypothetical protein
MEEVKKVEEASAFFCFAELLSIPIVIGLTPNKNLFQRRIK